MTYIKFNSILYSSCLFLLIIFFSCKSKRDMATESTTNYSWNGKKCAIVLTYDDALNVHLDNVIPELDVYGFKGTFYVPTESNDFKSRASEWQAVASNGHELGNHTEFHPCAGKSKGRAWVHADSDLDTYSYDQIIDEIQRANKKLTALDGKKERTYAYTCGDTSVLEISYVPGVKPLFVSARGVYGAMNDLETLDRYDLKAYSMNGQTADDMKALVDQAILEERLLIFLFHGVGGEHHLNISKKEHKKLLKYIKKKEKEIWVDSALEISKFIKEKT